MMDKDKMKYSKTGWIHISPWVIMGSLLVMIPIFIFTTMESIETQRKNMILTLSEKGDTLIRSFEAGTRTGMTNTDWGGANVQRLIMEIAEQPDILYILITDKDGKIVAHNQPDNIGKLHEPEMHKMHTIGATALWRIKKASSGKQVFEVYRSFNPAQGKEICKKKDCPPGSSDWFSPHMLAHPLELPKQVIFVGLNMDPYEQVIRETIKQKIIVAVILLMYGLLGIVSIVIAQNFRLTKASLSNEIEDLKQEVERKERLASIGSLAAGVAHEIRNPLSSIKGFATYFKERYKNIPEDQKIADIMIGEVERLNRVISQLLEFARPMNLRKESTSIPELMNRSLDMIAKQAAAKNITINRDSLAGDLHFASIDPDKIGQVLLNVFLNAIEAMDEGGTLLVSIQNDAKKQKLHIRVSDTGHGIASGDIPHVFDPYFTTKQSGTGLGLAIVHKIIEAHEGEIKVESAPEQGTSVFITLPSGDERS
jgi:two-component system, NtrC family, sensor histidine kinase HydH